MDKGDWGLIADRRKVSLWSDKSPHWIVMMVAA